MPDRPVEAREAREEEVDRALNRLTDYKHGVETLTVYDAEALLAHEDRQAAALEQMRAERDEIQLYAHDFKRGLEAAEARVAELTEALEAAKKVLLKQGRSDGADILRPIDHVLAALPCPGEPS